jgi:predicted phage tail protein
MITTIHLHGEMGKRFGRVWKLAVATPAEALRAIEANKPGLIEYLATAEERGVRFRVKVGEDQITEPEMIQFAARGRKITFSPVVQGGKSKYLGLIIGVALIAFTWGASAGLLGAGLKGFMAATAFGIKGLTFGAMIGGIGISLAVGGVAQMLTGTPKVNAQDPGTKSFGFGGPVNVSAQGGPVPIVYGGPVVVGSVRISASVKSEDRPGRTSGLVGNGGGYSGGGGGYVGDGVWGEGPFTRFPPYLFH